MPLKKGYETNTTAPFESVKKMSYCPARNHIGNIKPKRAIGIQQVGKQSTNTQITHCPRT